MSNENKKGRKSKETDYNNIFAVRLRELINATEKKQQEIADNIGVSRQALNKWVNGETIPDIFSAAKIADLFNISTDYLTGRTGTKSVSPEIQAACEVTGLSEKTIKNIIKLKQAPAAEKEFARMAHIIDLLIDDLKNYMDCDDNAKMSMQDL